MRRRGITFSTVRTGSNHFVPLAIEVQSTPDTAPHSVIAHARLNRNSVLLNTVNPKQSTTPLAAIRLTHWWYKCACKHYIMSDIAPVSEWLCVGISGWGRRQEAATTKVYAICFEDSEIIPTRCNNCVYSSQWLYSTCFGWRFHPLNTQHSEKQHGITRQCYLQLNTTDNDKTTRILTKLQHK